MPTPPESPVPKSPTAPDYEVPMETPLDRRPRLSRQSSRKEQLSGQISSRSRSRPRSPSNSDRKPRGPARSNVWSNESMTSFRVSRRSLMSDNEILSRKSGSIRSSAPNRGFDRQNSNNTLILLEDEPGSSHANPPSPPSSSLHHNYSKGVDSNGSAGLGTPVIHDDDDDPLSQQFPQQHSGSNQNNTAFDDDKSESCFQWRSKLAVVRITSGHFVNSLAVQIIMSIFIVANAVILGALTYDSIDDETRHILETIDLVILVAFTIEIILHCIYLGLRLFSDSWLTFDFVVILLSWCFLGSSLAVLRSFRIFRIFSLVSRWESLRTLFEAIGSTIPRVCLRFCKIVLSRCAFVKIVTHRCTFVSFYSFRWLRFGHHSSSSFMYLASSLRLFIKAFTKTDTLTMTTLGALIKLLSPCFNS
jgi:hypothetical protein